MTKKEIKDYINGLIKRSKDAKEKGKSEKSLNEILFDFYTTVATHYDNKIPESIHKEFIKSTPGFKNYLDEKMDEYTKESKEANAETTKLENDVKAVSKQISDLKAGQINVAKDRLGKNAPDTDSLKNLLEMIVSGEKDKKPEEVDSAYFYLYKMHSNGNEISKSVHDMIIEAHPQLAETLREYNNEEEKEKLQEKLEDLQFSLTDVKMKKDSVDSKIISVYDDSPKYTSNREYNGYLGFGRC